MTDPTTHAAPVVDPVIASHAVLFRGVPAHQWEGFIRRLTTGHAQLECLPPRPGVRILVYGPAGSVRACLEAPSLSFYSEKEEESFLEAMQKAFHLARMANLAVPASLMDLHLKKATPPHDQAIL